MARVNRIADITNGEPLTYQKISEIISKVNNLISNFNQNAKNTIVTFKSNKAKNVKPSDDLTVFIGSKEIDPTKNNKTEFNFDFDGFKETPVVVASVRYKPDNSNNEEDATQDTPSVTLTVLKVNKDSFTASLFFNTKSLKKVNIDYIAIGKTGDTNN